VFTARYALGPYIKQIRLVFKGLSRRTGWPQSPLGYFVEDKILLPPPGLKPPFIFRPARRISDGVISMNKLHEYEPLEGRVFLEKICN
jgi:hypothetical protein